MQFRLVYRGLLRSNADPRHKQEIRRALHPQLRELWRHPPLDNFGDRWLAYPAHQNDSSVIRPVGPFKFAHLICDELRLLAELNVVMLRPTPPGALLRAGGDIDNQLKTLFDALRAPLHSSELPRGDVPREGEDPLFCLLDDDERIVDLRVSVDRYLDAPADDQAVYVVIFVRTRPSYVTVGNLPLV